MTIKLLTPYGKYPYNAIITLDSATETALIAAGTATATTAGGVVWVDPATLAARQVELTPAQVAAGAIGVAGVKADGSQVGPDGGTVSGGGDVDIQNAGNTLIPAGTTQMFVETTAPSNADGRADGTIWIQV